MSADQEQAIRVDPNLDSAASRRLAFGEVAWFSTPSPDHPDRNEDAAVILLAPSWCVLAVCDGAGGTAKGDRAAAMTVKILQQSLKPATPPEQIRAALLDAIESADDRIRDEIPGALATVALFALDGKHARPISVGDSICAVIGGRGKLKYRSVAHGPTGFAEEAGLLGEREAMTHDERHLVSNMLGLPGMRVEVGRPLRLALRDTVLVASDALFDNLRFSEIAELARRRPLAAAVDALAGRARGRMTHDGAVSHADDLTILAFRRG